MWVGVCVFKFFYQAFPLKKKKQEILKKFLSHRSLRCPSLPLSVRPASACPAPSSLQAATDTGI